LFNNVILHNFTFSHNIGLSVIAKYIRWYFS